MTPRELAGAIRRARTVFVYALYASEEDAHGEIVHQHGLYLRVTKDEARGVVDDARRVGLEDVPAQMRREALYIGA
jgi:hypothetical protein